MDYAIGTGFTRPRLSAQRRRGAVHAGMRIPLGYVAERGYPYRVDKLDCVTAKCKTPRRHEAEGGFFPKRGGIT